MLGMYLFMRGLAPYVFGNTRTDEDWIDKWNRVYTLVMLMAFCMFSSMSNIVGDPVICWNQGPLSGHDSYINTYCWVSNTYWLPLREDIPKAIPEREQRELSYYQWVPIILLIMAFFFYVPRLVWRALRERSGINLKRVAKAATGVDSLDPENRNNTLKYLAVHIHDCLENDRKPKRHGCMSEFRKVLNKFCFFLFCTDKGTGYRLFNTYLLIKFLYIANVCIQLVVLDIFLRGKWVSWYGFEIVHNLLHEHAWKETGKFPRVTMCDFEIRVLGNLHRHTVQCVLPINLYNEKMFIVIWFWFVILFFLNVFSFLKWTYTMYWPRSRYSWIKVYVKRLKMMDTENKPARKLDAEEKKYMEKFVNSYLRVDGVFALMTLSANTNELVTAGIVKQLWDKFYKTHGPRRDMTIQATTDETPTITPSPNGKRNGLRGVVDTLRSKGIVG